MRFLTLAAVLLATPALAETKSECLSQTSRFVGSTSCEKPAQLVQQVASECRVKLTAQDRRDVTQAVREWQKYRGECRTK